MEYQWLYNLLQIVPFTKFIGLIGSRAKGTARADSDIDLLIVAQYKRIYTTRAFIVFLEKILRFSGLIKRNFLCFNLFFTDRFLSFPREDPLLANDFMTLKTICGKLDKRELIKANSWIKKYSNDKNSPNSLKTKLIAKHFFAYAMIKSSLEKILDGNRGDHLEKYFKMRLSHKVNQQRKILKGTKEFYFCNEKQICFWAGEKFINRKSADKDCSQREN